MWFAHEGATTKNNTGQELVKQEHVIKEAYWAMTQFICWSCTPQSSNLALQPPGERETSRSGPVATPCHCSESNMESLPILFSVLGTDLLHITLTFGEVLMPSIRSVEAHCLFEAIPNLLAFETLTLAIANFLDLVSSMRIIPGQLSHQRNFSGSH